MSELDNDPRMRRTLTLAPVLMDAAELLSAYTTVDHLLRAVPWHEPYRARDRVLRDELLRRLQ